MLLSFQLRWVKLYNMKKEKIEFEKELKEAEEMKRQHKKNQEEIGRQIHEVHI